MARIVLVNPQLAYSSWAAPIMRRDMDATIKHGLASLSACLKAGGHSVDLIDLRMLRGWREYDALIRRGQWDCLAVSVNTCEHDDALECFRRARKIRPALKTIAGGVQPTMFPDEFLKTGAVDHVLAGEGETGIVEWIADPSAFPRVFRGKTPDLDRLPFEDRELWPDYRRRTGFPWVGRHLATPIVGMLAHRGCPWHCRFCCGPGGRNVAATVRTRAVGHVMGELTELRGRYGFKGIYFHDDQFLINPGWVEEFCAAMHALGFVKEGVGFTVSLRVDTIVRHERLMLKLKKAGLEIVCVGFESFNDHLLQWMNKDITVAQQLEAARILHACGIKIRANVMLGLPRADGQWRAEDDFKTIMILRKIRPIERRCSVFAPIPGSDFYDWYERQGMILCHDFRHLARRGGAPQLKGVDYDFLDKLLGRAAAPGRAARAWKHALNAVGLLVPARRARREWAELQGRLRPGARFPAGRGKQPDA